MRGITILVVAVYAASCRAALGAVPTPRENAALIEKLMRTVEDLKKTVEQQQRVIADLSSRLGAAGSAPPRAEAGGLIPERLSREIETALAGERLEALATSDEAAGQRFRLPAPQILQGLNPDISAVGDMIYDLSDNSNPKNRAIGGGGDRMQLRELELGFQAAVDPYVKGTAFIGFHGEHTHLEEAYAESMSLPFGLQAKGGRFLADFGKLNKVHTHDLPQVDRPLVLASFLGDEGLKGDGLGVSWLVPNPWEQYVNLTFNALNGFDRGEEEGKGDAAGGGGVEGLTHYSNLLYLARASSYHDITENQNVEAGLSGFAVDDRDGFQSTVGGIDLTYRWKPLRRGLYRSFLARSELLMGKNETPHGNQNPWGMYAYGEYQFARGLMSGLRFDYTQLFTDDAADEYAFGPYLTWWASEFFRLRLQYQHVTSDALPHEDRIYLQGTFVMGAHGAHKF